MTKHKLKDKVWFMHCNSITSKTVGAIFIRGEGYVTSYYFEKAPFDVRTTLHKSADELFSSKEELLKYLTKDN